MSEQPKPTTTSTSNCTCTSTSTNDTTNTQTLSRPEYTRTLSSASIASTSTSASTTTTLVPATEASDLQAPSRTLPSASRASMDFFVPSYLRGAEDLDTSNRWRVLRNPSYVAYAWRGSRNATNNGTVRVGDSGVEKEGKTILSNERGVIDDLFDYGN